MSPSLPLYQIPFVLAFTKALRNVVRFPGNLFLERGELVARGVASPAAIAVSLLAVSGAGGGRADSEARRNGRGRYRPSPSPRASTISWALAVGLRPRHLRFAAIAPVLEAPFDTGSGYSWRPKLVSGVESRRSILHAHVPHPPGGTSGATAYRSRPGDFILTLRAPVRGCLTPRARVPRTARFAASERSMRRRSGGPAATLRRLAFVLRADPPVPRTPNQDLENVWIDSIVDPKTGAAIGSGPVLIEKWERGARSSCCDGNARTGDPTALMSSAS